MKQRLTSKEWSELRTLAETETIGPDRRDRGLMLAAMGIMSACGAKLHGFDARNLLPIKRNDTDALAQFAEFFEYSQRHNSQWPSQ